MTIAFIGSNHHGDRNGTRVDTIVIHHTGDDMPHAAVKWFRNRHSRVSAHYVIERDGQVVQMVEEDRAAWHAGLGKLPWETCHYYNVNLRSIGIELVNLGDGKQPFTDEQYRALAQLLDDVCDRLPGKLGVIVQPVRGRPPEEFAHACEAVIVTGHVLILGHRDIAPGRKTDPADNFDWARVRKALTFPEPTDRSTFCRHSERPEACNVCRVEKTS